MDIPVKGDKLVLAGAQNKFTGWLNAWTSPGWAFIFSFGVYLLLSGLHGSPWGLSINSYFNYLADALLHGQLHLRVLPQSVHDLSFFQGRYYLYWPPFPAIFLMPFVALFGIQVSDIFITTVLSAVNVALVAVLLNSFVAASLVRLSVTQRGILVAFFALGTVQLTLAPLGRVYFTAQEIGFMAVAIAYIAALRMKGWGAFWLAGIAMGCALTTRNHLLFAGIWPAWYLIRKHTPAGWKKLAGYLAAGAAPVIVAGLLLISYNIARFGAPLDVGLNYHQMAPMFREDYKLYGAFSLHYLPANLFYQYINYPFPDRSNTTMGGSLFLLSPLFIFLFYGIWNERGKISTWLLIASILCVNIPILLLMGTGWIQFGPRYTLDFTIPMLLLTAVGIQKIRNQITLPLGLISCMQYFAGYLLLIQKL